MTPLKQQVSVFFIYAHHDKKIVFKLYQRMIKAGIDVWLDSEKLEPGQNWQYEIRRAILQSDAVLVCLSQKFNEQQGYRHDELKLALEKANLMDAGKIFIIPVRLEKCEMPEPLSHLHRVDLFEQNGFKKLLRALKRMEEVL